ncbi:hypothetical protein ANN_22277 [Periplaneta americana]|uniref:DUF4817 domain-containing protein n=1 Tax=Periplaneta americana TaxID=6978 RepID=A0ABQ8S7X9_PERAM|nr:hypothetical protein ANN_22277 [Periplaneta americana]
MPRYHYERLRCTANFIRNFGALMRETRGNDVIGCGRTSYIGLTTNKIIVANSVVTIYCANPQTRRIPKPKLADYTKVRCVPRLRADNPTLPESSPLLPGKDLFQLYFVITSRRHSDPVKCSLTHRMKMGYAIRKVQDNRQSLELNGLYQLLAYADDVNMLGENPQTIRENTEILLELFSTFCVNVKMQYTLYQRLFLVKQYWITNSITATQRAYQREFGVRNPPKRNTIWDW